MAAQRGAERSAGELNGRQNVRGRIFGLNGVVATVVLGDQAQVMLTTQTDTQGRFEFTGVPYGTFFVKAEAKGLALSPAQVVTVNPPTVLSNFGALSQTLAAPVGLVFSATSGTTDTFSFHWDTTSGGQEASAHIVAPPVIQFRDEAVTPPDTAASASLYASFNVVLSDEGAKWTHEAASRLLTTLGIVPTRPYTNLYFEKPFRKSKWVLTDQFLADDIRIERSAAGDTVVLSKAALVYATPRLVYLDGVPGKYFSKRLHHAVVRFATDNGNDREAAERILIERFSLRTSVPDYLALTREDASRFGPFRPAELVDIINILEEMPEGFHKINGLHTLVRRAIGQVNPVNKDIIARAFPDAGYIELTDAALIPSKLVSPHRVILHEKAHFLWAKVFSTQQKNDWAALGGWYRNPANATQWLTRQSTSFVSALAHDVDPNEDMAESLADYILNPSLLQSRALAKFNFIKDRIFRGDRFVPVIRDDLTFTVVDLFPDYAAPGKVKSIDLLLRGAPAADKKGTISIELFGDTSPSAGANMCIVSFLSPSGQPVGDAFALYPRTAEGYTDDRINRTSLSGTFYFSRFAETGYWRVHRVYCTDLTGNIRYLNPADVGNAAVYINSALQSVAPPVYEPGSMSVAEIAPGVLEGRAVRRVQASWRIKPHALDIPVIHAELVNLDSLVNHAFGTMQYDKASRTVTFTYSLPDYLPSGRYGIPWLTMVDQAGNRTTQGFPDPALLEEVRYVRMAAARPDNGSAPELDLNRISVTATPTRPAAPNGETIVKIVFYARDDLSGLDSIYINLLNPQGELTSAAFYTNSAPGGLDYRVPNKARFFSGDPTLWQRYEATIMLPVGAVPGLWGIQTMHMSDKAGFHKQYDFVELMHFVVTDK